jgi:hypothetical protein
MTSGHEDLSGVNVDVIVGELIRTQQLGQGVSLADLESIFIVICCNLM